MRKRIWPRLAALVGVLIFFPIAPAGAQQARLEPYIPQEYGRVETGMKLNSSGITEDSNGMLNFFNWHNVQPEFISFDGKRWRPESVKSIYPF